MKGLNLEPETLIPLEKDTGKNISRHRHDQKLYEDWIAQ